MRYHLTPVRMAIIKMSTNSKCCCEGVEEREGSCTAGGNVSWHGRCGGRSVCTVLSCSGTFDSVTATLQPARLLSTGVLQASIVEWVAMPSSRGIFPTQGSNPGLLCCRHILYPSRSPEKPKNIGMGSLSLLMGTSWSRNWTGVSCIAGGFFTSWANRKAQKTVWRLL